jgi:hypothetical protein
MVLTIENNQIEISLDGNFHDWGLDMSLKFEQPLSPTQSSLIDLNASFFECCGNGFKDQNFSSGIISPVPLLGDMNGDFDVTVADAPLLVEALVNRSAYDAHLYDGRYGWQRHIRPGRPGGVQCPATTACQCHKCARAECTDVVPARPSGLGSCPYRTVCAPSMASMAGFEAQLSLVRHDTRWLVTPALENLQLTFLPSVYVYGTS